MSEETAPDIITLKIVKHCNVETDNFLSINISHLVFIDIFMSGCVKGTLPKEIKIRAMDNEDMLTAIYILISHLVPDIMMKYIWFNILPSNQKHLDLLKTPHRYCRFKLLNHA
ncbi:hypothetical protein RF11_12482 [Thelohanellus kitauei]|uniref:Uncharacterized protein n=1 Tax=Thelohanellus kitauei TaxID=669202 RepID=A0A0C2N037_THEKT|nr:hypothetical protein RF11_12482 [Thelohanellus kitauei]